MFDTACALDPTDLTVCAGVANRLGVVAHQHHLSHGDGGLGGVSMHEERDGSHPNTAAWRRLVKHTWASFK